MSYDVTGLVQPSADYMSNIFGPQIDFLAFGIGVDNVYMYNTRLSVASLALRFPSVDSQYKKGRVRKGL